VLPLGGPLLWVACGYSHVGCLLCGGSPSTLLWSPVGVPFVCPLWWVHCSPKGGFLVPSGGSPEGSPVGGPR
jgi:hypothetical protein